ncbi:MAG: hypothetical protein IKQ59_06465 [Prevotella sp.]|nr:hypothetical protein [Prevotella sp.]
MAKTEKKDFKEYLKTLDEKERLRIRQEFLTMTGLAYPSWYVKTSSGGFSRLELLALEKICGEKFVD